MEDSQFQSRRRDFHPRRRSPLMSETCRTLSRVLSLFDDQNQPPRLVKFSPYLFTPGSLNLDDLVLNDAEETTKQGTDDHVKMGVTEVEKKKTFYEGEEGAVEEGFEGLKLSGRGPNEAQMALDKIADLMSTDEDDHGDLLKEKENIAKETAQVVDLEDNRSSLEQMIVDELKALVNGNFGPVEDNNGIDCNALSSDKTPCGDDIVEMENKQEEQSGFQESAVDKFKEVTPILQDGEQSSEKPSETLCSSPGSNAVAPQTRESEEIMSSEVTIQHKDSGAPHDNLLAPTQMLEDDQPEEGELSDGIEIEVPAPVSSEYAQSPDEKLGKGQLPELVVRGVHASSRPLDISFNPSEIRAEVEETDGDDDVLKDGLDSNGKSKHLESQRVDRCNNFISDGKTELQQRAPNEVANIPAARPNDLIFYGDILEENEIADEKLTSEKDVGLQKKRKRGPGSQQRKEKKKLKERKKRADKNRDLGVKRLKLQPVQMPKKIPLCRHYIHGRCQEGEKCKFSHDTIPITKSTPCCYFARHSCMKGDNCPFDHELSKYPCSNFSSKGSCIRGDSCLFSHKILPKDSTSAKINASGPESRPPSKPDDSGTKKRPDINIASARAAGPVLESLGICFKGMDQIIASSLGKAHVQKSNVGSNPVKDLRMSSPIKSGRSNLVKQKDESQLNDQAKESSSSGSTKKTSEGVKTSPLVTPRGINFLSFAGSSSRIANSGLPKSDDTITGERVKAAVKVQQDMSEKVFGSNEIPMRAQGVGCQELTNIVSAKNPPLNDASTGKQATSPRADDRFAQGEGMNKLQRSSVKDGKMPTFSVIPHQQAESSTPSPYKSISSSAQKVLSSTLAFAARCEKEVMMKNRSTVDHATSSATSKETTSGAQQNDSAGAQKILDFLLSISKKK